MCPQGVKYLQEHGIPVFRFPESAAKAFGALYRYSQWLNRQHLASFKLSHDTKAAQGIIADALASGKTYLGELEGSDLLKHYGFDILPNRLSTSAEEATEIASAIGYPVVMKIFSPDIIHKSDAGGVLVGLEDDAAIRTGFEQIMANARAFKADADIKGILVQKMAPKGRR